MSACRASGSRASNEVVKKAIDAGEVAGVVTLVARRGKVVHFEAQGYADIASKKPMRTDNIFRLASMGKPVTAVAIMMLVEEGKIRLTDPVSQYIPEFKGLTKVAVPKPGGAEGAYDLVDVSRPITIRDLLTHGSGLLSGGLGQRAAGQSVQRAPEDTLATYIPKLGSVPLDFQPGTLWRYSGLAGFDVLSRVVEVVSGQPYDRWLKEHIFTPLAMPDSGFYFTGQQAERVATIYTRRPGEALQPQPNQALSSVYFSGAGGLATSAADYLQFAQMLLNGGELDGKRLLGPRTVDLMVSNHTGDMVNGQFGRPARGMGFGLGMQMVLDPVAADLAVSQGAFSWPGRQRRRVLGRAERRAREHLHDPGRQRRGPAARVRERDPSGDHRLSAARDAACVSVSASHRPAIDLDTADVHETSPAMTAAG